MGESNSSNLAPVFKYLKGRRCFPPDFDPLDFSRYSDYPARLHLRKNHCRFDDSENSRGSSDTLLV